LDKNELIWYKSQILYFKFLNYINNETSDQPIYENKNNIDIKNKNSLEVK